MQNLNFVILTNVCTSVSRHPPFTMEDVVYLFLQKVLLHHFPSDQPMPQKQALFD